MTDPDAHEKLLGCSDFELLMMAGRATHQHFKGGLYQLLGPAFDVSTGKETDYGYLHLYPHREKLYLRNIEEFEEMVDTPDFHPMYGSAEKIKRFRKLGEGW